MSRLDCCSLTRAIMTQLRNEDSGPETHHNEYNTNSNGDNERPLNITINITINKNEVGKEDEK